MSDHLVDYIQALVRQTRESPDIEIGLSPRGAQALAAAARAHAFVERHSGVYSLTTFRPFSLQSPGTA